MRVSLGIALCWLLAGSAMAQRGGMGGGFRGGFGGVARGGIVSGGSFRGGFNGFGGFRPGVDSRFFGNRFFFSNRFFFGNRFFGNRFFFDRRFFGFRRSFVFPAFGLGFSYVPGFYGYPYYPTNPVYAPSPNVTVVYPPQTQTAPATAYVERTDAVTHENDQYDNRSSGGASPIYLVAFKDRVIRAAAAYWVDGRTLHYVTLQHEEKEVPLDTVDRDFTLQLNRERHVPFQLPIQ
jgi:hypothetical protein